MNISIPIIKKTIAFWMELGKDINHVVLKCQRELTNEALKYSAI